MDRKLASIALTVAWLLAGCGSTTPIAPPPSPAGSPVAQVDASTPTPQASAPPATPSTPGATVSPFPYRTEPIAVEPGTYRIPKSAWSVADFTITLPDGWTVQYGHLYAHEVVTVYAVVVDAIYADACKGSYGELMKVGRSVDDLADALLQQPGPEAHGPIDTTLGGYPAVRIDLTVPDGFDLKACRVAGIGLQIWYSQPADKYLLLTHDEIASVYILDVDGQRQVFLTEQVSAIGTYYSTAATTEDLAELQAVLDSIQIEP